MNCRCVCRLLIPTLTEEETEAGIEEILKEVGDSAIQDYTPNQPRDERGRFTSTGRNGGKTNFDRERKKKELCLKKSEYARVMRALNSDLAKEERAKKIITKPIGNYLYTVENNGFDNYRIIDKIRLK